jgi:hypothetical protein
MRTRLTAILLAVVLAALTFVPAAGADDHRSIDGTLTFSTFQSENGVVRGVFANFNLRGFTAADIDDEGPGGVVVRLYDASDSSRTISQVSLRDGAFRVAPGVDLDAVGLTAPIDSVWGTFDYAADGYWTQPRNLRINGGNCERIGGAEVTIRLTEGRNPVPGTIDGPPRGSCGDIRP